MAKRSGFALLAVLWVVAAAGVSAAMLNARAREGIDVAANSIAATRAYWAAEACASLAMARIDSSLTSASLDARLNKSAWRHLDQVLGAERLSIGPATCSARLISDGTGVDLNGAPSSQLRALLVNSGAPVNAADSITAAMLDWRDPDDLQREGGAEHASYSSRGLPGPRNGPFAAAEEVRGVYGFDRLHRDVQDSVIAGIGVGGAPIDLSHAPRRVVATLPGASPDVADQIARLIATGEPSDVSQLVIRLPAPARDSGMKYFSEWISRATVAPSQWRLEVRGASGTPLIAVQLELLLSEGADHAGIVRRRFWLE